jgi:hypothetical protein
MLWLLLQPLPTEPARDSRLTTRGRSGDASTHEHLWGPLALRSAGSPGPRSVRRRFKSIT